MSRPSPRDLPPVNAVFDRPELVEARAGSGREAALAAVRRSLEESRAGLLRGEAAATDPGALAARASAILAEGRPALRRVINATGVLLHTGLGRAPLSREAVEAVAAVARGYCNLEVDLDTGERGRRTTGVAELLKRLTGAEAATVVNNNAAATVLALRALAIGREVIVSRGELIEIGGSFRLPEIFEVSGATLREVGTTNRTRLGDYERAINPQTAALLRVHPSNFRVTGFTESVGIAELAELAHSRGLRAIDDIGSGSFGKGLPPIVSGEPTVAEGVSAGADLVLCSGDKLLGGPQCGLMIGRRDAISLAERDPLMRAFRVDKMTLAALEATLRLVLEPEQAARKIPLWSFMTNPPDALKERAERLAEAFRSEFGLGASVVEETAFFGGGSLPCETLPTFAVRVGPPFPCVGLSEGRWSRCLRLGTPAVFTRVRAGAVLFDLRAVEESDDDDLIRAVKNSTTCE